MLNFRVFQCRAVCRMKNIICTVESLKQWSRKVIKVPRKNRNCFTEQDLLISKNFLLLKTLHWSCGFILVWCAKYVQNELSWYGALAEKSITQKSLFIHVFHSEDGNETARLISHSAEGILFSFRSNRVDSVLKKFCI